MQSLEYSAACRDIVERIGGVDATDEVLVLTDPVRLDIARTFAARARAVGATTTLLVKPRLETHGSELPEIVAGAMLRADIVFDLNTHAITHTRARRDATDAGVPFVLMRGITAEMLEAHVDTDYDELRTVTRAVAALQTAASTAHVTTPWGTDISVDLTGRDGHPVDDDFSDGFVGIPAGKAAITPVEGSARGTIVVDYSIDGIGTLDRPIELRVEDGTVIDVDGGEQAAELERRLEAAGEGARNIAEAPSLGTNPEVTLTGNQATDKKKRGTVHFAVGDNRSLGGSIESAIHFDMTLTQPTVRLDDFVVLDDGTLLTESIRERAAALGH